MRWNKKLVLSDSELSKRTSLSIYKSRLRTVSGYSFTRVPTASSMSINLPLA